MTVRPIIFSTPMILALLAGRKTQTRRILRDQETWTPLEAILKRYPHQKSGLPYSVGDLLYVRENITRSGALIQYVADRRASHQLWGDAWKQDPRPSIHMPRTASRLTLEVNEVRVQRLRDISAADAIAEGIRPAANSSTIDCDTPNPREDFRALWNSLHGAEAWEANPWIVALSFSVHQQNIDALLKQREKVPA